MKLILFCVFVADFPHLAAVRIHCSCRFNYEAEAVPDASHVCDGFPDMLSAGKALVPRPSSCVAAVARLPSLPSAPEHRKAVSP